MCFYLQQLSGIQKIQKKYSDVIITYNKIIAIAEKVKAESPAKNEM